MKTTLKIAIILTWFNIIFWGVIGGFAILFGVFSGALSMLIAAILVGAIPLNCYAALKLQASIRNPALPLSSQTPTGVRFVGFIALFFGMSSLSQGFVTIRNPNAALDLFKDQMAQMPAQALLIKSITAGDVRWLGIFILILGIFVVVNVVLNLRLLRWYFLVRKSDADKKP